MLEQTQLQSRWRVNNLHVSFSRCHCACALDIRKGYDAITGSYDKLRHHLCKFISYNHIIHSGTESKVASDVLGGWEQQSMRL